jgi:uncharacterized integral membrane protein
MKHKIRLGIAALCLLLVVIFTLQNAQVVEVKLLWWDVAMSRSIMVFGLLLIGFIIGRTIRFKKHRKEKNP